MNEPEQQFIQELTNELGDHSEKENIIADYEAHVFDLLEDVSINKEHIYDELVKRLGSPQEIAKMWKIETGVTPKKVQWLFIICNIAIFIGGTLLTVSYHVFHWDWINQLWAGLSESVFIIMLIYTLFWGLLGYEIGKEFGHRGYRLLKKTFVISIIPNLLLMYLITFKILPHEWFQPILNFPFILACIIFTSLLYPVSLIGYRWGKKVSV